jgi:hypothetical protein
LAGGDRHRCHCVLALKNIYDIRFTSCSKFEINA